MSEREPAEPVGVGPCPSSEASRYCVGVIHYRAYPDLPDCLGAVAGQTIPPRWVRVIDSVDQWAPAGENADLAHALAGAPAVGTESIENRGYGHAANRLIAHAARDPGCEYLLLLNPDVVLAPDSAEVMLRALDEDPSAALAGGRLLRPGGGRVDSAGIFLGRNRRPRDRGMDELADGRYCEEELVFAASGAALWLRVAAAQELAIAGEVFDEDFFAYHDETDLAWRAALLGWHVRYVPGATARHERGWKRGQRFEIPVHIRRHSFKNHALQMIKNDRWGEWLRDLPVIVGWELTRFLFALLRDPAMLPAYLDIVRLLPRALRKRREIQRRATGRVRFGR